MPQVTTKHAVVWSVGLLTALAACTTPRAIHAPSPTPRSLRTLPSAAANTLPGSQKLPPGALITSVVRFGGREVAAGDDFPAGGPAVLPTCYPDGCNPIVWTSLNGSNWTAT